MKWMTEGNLGMNVKGQDTDAEVQDKFHFFQIKLNCKFLSPWAGGKLELSLLKVSCPFGAMLWLWGFLQCPVSGTSPLPGVACREIPLHTLTWYQCTWETPTALFRKNKPIFRPWEVKTFFTLQCGAVCLSLAPTHKLQAQLCRSKSLTCTSEWEGLSLTRPLLLWLQLHQLIAIVYLCNGGKKDSVSGCTAGHLVCETIHPWFPLCVSSLYIVLNTNKVTPQVRDSGR